MLGPKEISSIVLNVLFVASFLCVFFFTYVVIVEKAVIQKQVTMLVDHFSEELQLLSPEQLKMIKNKMASIKKPNLSESDKKVKESNKKILINAIIAISVAFAICIIGVYFASKHWNFSFLGLVAKSSIILLFIGITEYCFLEFFARKYILADPNYVKSVAIDVLQSPEGYDEKSELVMNKIDGIINSEIFSGSKFDNDKFNNLMNYFSNEIPY